MTKKYVQLKKMRAWEFNTIYYTVYNSMKEDFDQIYAQEKAKEISKKANIQFNKLRKEGYSGKMYVVRR